MNLSLLKKLLSYLYPVRVRSSSSPLNPVLELYYYQGRWQLGAVDVLYSDGHKYRPLVAAFKAMGSRLPGLKRVLVLGTGLGSAVTILERMGYHPAYTLVELDRVVLDWATELLPKDVLGRVTPRCADAKQFIEKDQSQYDLIIVDVFIGRIVPYFAVQTSFLLLCRERLNPGGRLVLNYMVNMPGDETRASGALEAIFRNVQEIRFGINRVYIATA